MSTHRHFDAICVAVLIVTLLITVLFMNGEALGIRVIVDEDAEQHSGDSWFTTNDRDGIWDSEGATQITLNGSSATVSGGGAYVLNGDVVISSAGKYVLSGSLDDGSVIIDTDKSAKVWILLNSVDIHSSDAPCLDVEQAEKVFLTLAAGTENSMTTTGFSSEATENGEDGTVFARDDLTINGSGSLTVSSPLAHGIVGNDDLKVTGGSVIVEAALDALHANDCLHLAEAALNLTAGDDGLAVTGEESTFYLESGELTVTAADKGINVAGEMLIAGGSLTIESGDDGISAAGNITVENGDITITAGDDGIHSDVSVAVSGGTLLMPACYEGIEAKTIDISGGDITIYPLDDGLNANGGSSSFGMGGMPGGGGGPGGMGGGQMQEPPEMPEGTEMEDFAEGEMPEPPEGMDFGSAPDDAQEGSIPEPPEMPEGMDFDGQPDGEPAGGPMEAAGSGENTGTDTASDSTDETWIHISGGSITVINDSARDADGLDSNGDIIITGGTVRVSLVNSGSNSALDYGSESGGVMTISGGTVVACGSYSMAEGFDSSSTQCAILYNIKRGVAAGRTVSLEDSEGNVIISYEVPCSFSSLIISCPEMRLGETYTVVIGDTAEEITLEEVSASYGDAQSEGFGGNMNWGGGMQFRPHRPQVSTGESGN